MKQLHTRKLKRGISSAAITALVVVAVILLNAGFGVLSDLGRWMIDLTSEKMYTLTDATVEMLDGTIREVNANRADAGEEDVLVDIIFCADPDLLKGNEQMRYIYYTARALEKAFPDTIQVSTTNVWTNPSSVDAYRTSSYSSIYQSNIIVASGTEFRITSVETYYTYDSETSNSEPWAYNAEKKFVQSIIAVTRAEAPICGVTINHGEALATTEGQAEYSELLNVIRNAGYDICYLDLTKDEIPENCRLLLTFDPQSDFLGKQDLGENGVSELSQLRSFLNASYSYMVFVDADTPVLPNLEEFLSEWGIAFNRTVDENEDWTGNWRVWSDSALDASGSSVIADYESEALGGSITENMRELGGSPKVVFGNAMPIRYSASYETVYQLADEDNGTGAFTYGSYYRNNHSRAIYDLFRANATSVSYGVKNGTVTENPIDTRGNYRLMTITRESRTVGEGQGYTNVNDASYVCAIGSTEFASNKLLGSNAYGNTDVLLETLRAIGREVVPVGLSFKPMYDSDMTQSPSSSSGTTTVYYYTEAGNVARTVVLTVLPAVLLTTIGTVVLVRRKFRH